MGRMLEAFKLIDPSKPPTAAPPGPHLAWPEPEPATPPESTEEEIPFIEVGGPRETMQASPQVLAAGAKLGKPKPLPATGARLRSVSPPSLSEAPARIMSVALRPLPGDASRLEPAHLRFAPELIAFHRPEHPVSEQYRSLAEGIASQWPVGRAQVVLFTALRPGTGTTTVLLNIAIVFARQGKLRVAVVDANLRHPALARRLGLPESPGLREFLAGSKSLAEAMQETGQPNLLALTAGEGDAPLRPLGEAFRPVLRQLRERFDLVLVDAPCWDGRPEMVALGSACDAAYLVLPQSEAETPEAEAWVRTLPQQGAALRACILTQR
jgi:Mrp family chromosome partitioning ATPase